MYQHDVAKAIAQSDQIRGVCIDRDMDYVKNIASRINSKEKSPEILRVVPFLPQSDRHEFWETKKKGSLSHADCSRIVEFVERNPGASIVTISEKLKLKVYGVKRLVMQADRNKELYLTQDDFCYPLAEKKLYELHRNRIVGRQKYSLKSVNIGFVKKYLESVDYANVKEIATSIGSSPTVVQRCLWVLGSEKKVFAVKKGAAFFYRMRQSGEELLHSYEHFDLILKAARDKVNEITRGDVESLLSVRRTVAENYLHDLRDQGYLTQTGLQSFKYRELQA